jgi:hypothetical protein
MKWVGGGVNSTGCGSRCKCEIIRVVSVNDKTDLPIIIRCAPLCRLCTALPRRSLCVRPGWEYRIKYWAVLGNLQLLGPWLDGIFVSDVPITLFEGLLKGPM